MNERVLAYLGIGSGMVGGVLEGVDAPRWSFWLFFGVGLLALLAAAYEFVRARRLREANAVPAAPPPADAPAPPPATGGRTGYRVGGRSRLDSEGDTFSGLDTAIEADDDAEVRTRDNRIE